MLHDEWVEQTDGEVVVSLSVTNSRDDAEVLAGAVNEADWAPDDVAGQTVIVDEYEGEPVWGVRVADADEIEVQEEAAEQARQKINQKIAESDVIDESAFEGDE